MTEFPRELLRPEAFPNSHPLTVTLIETHISWVIVTDTLVYKLKKPVDFGFLDFTTIEARKQACDAEVELNARLSDGVYLGTIPLMRDAGGLRSFAREGDVVDWAVVMRRLADEDRADRLLERNALERNAVDELAELLSRFHATCRVDSQTSAFGHPDVIRRNIDENFAQARDVVRQVLSDAEAAEVEQWQRAFVSDHGERFAKRVHDGNVRDGHGDLRLEHVYKRASGGFDVIDCIEFNERFRYGDVCADLAFLSMDLTWHGRADLAERLVARYARDSNDYDLYGVVDFYESYRAFVRGKVCSFGLTPGYAEEKERQVRRYFALALASTRRPSQTPSVIAMGGLIASGKTSVADELSFALRCPTVEADRTRKFLMGVSPDTSLSGGAFKGAYTAEVSRRVYDELFRRAAVVLKSGRTVVVDASFRSQDERDRIQALARDVAAPFLFVECRVSRETALERLRRRTYDETASDARPSTYDAFVRSFEPVMGISSEEHLVLDTEQPVERCLARIHDHLGDVI